MIGIYKITSPSGKVYIGQSIRIKKRFGEYRRISGGVKSQRKLYHSFLKYGVSAHKFEVITECQEDDLNQLEIYFSDVYNSRGPNGLNLRECGGSTSRQHPETVALRAAKLKGRVRSPEERAKISATLMGNIPWNKGKKGAQSAWNKGISPSAETRKKLADHNSGKVGSLHGGAKKIIQYNQNGEQIRVFHGAREVERELGFAWSVVNRAARGERQSAYGYKWSYTK